MSMSPAILYLEERLNERRRVAGALAECLFWGGVLSVLRDRFAPRQLPAHETPDELLTSILLALHEDDGEARRMAAAGLRVLADHLDAGGEAPMVFTAFGGFEREVSDE